MLLRLRDHFCALRVAGLALAAALALGCGADEDANAAGARDPSAVEAADRSTADKPARKERPLPAFSGWTLDDERLQIADFLGKRVVVFLFEPKAPEAPAPAEAMARIAKLRAEHNFAVVGVAVGADRPAAQAFVKRHGLEFPVVDDASRRISRRFGLPSTVAVMGVDGDGYVTWGFAQFTTDVPDAADHIEKQLRGALRLPSHDAPPPGERPLAPTFSAPVLDAEQRFELASTRGQAVALIFFLHTCPHCHEALRFLRKTLAEMPEDKRPLLVGMEISGRTAAVRNQLRQDDLDFFPVLFDEGGAVQAEYGVFGGVPDLILIDRQGRIAGRTTGWRPESDGPIVRMRLAQLAGAPVPMLLRAKGYSGSEVCGVCHEAEHQTWQLTQHAHAYNTLVKHGAAADPECVGCHVVGFQEAGGFEISPPTPSLEDVGCESCHGRGGPHQSPGFVSDGSYESTCLNCHDPKHSLGFEYASFLPEVSHAANAAVLALPAAERERILAKRGALRTNLLPTAAEHVGSDACRSCHAQEYASWAAGPHAGALASLEAQGKSGEAECLRCHTTGFGRKGGFPSGAAPTAHADLARVGCESCHGPGGDHVTDAAVKRGSIVSLGDKCDSCVILQICGACHDDANDPGFEFEVQEKIDRIRHGTIEAGTGKPLPKAGKSARAPEQGAGTNEQRLLARAFAERDRRVGETWTRP